MRFGVVAILFMAVMGSAVAQAPAQPGSNVVAQASEANAFEVATRVWTAAGWREFLRLHPSSPNATLAREALASIERATGAAPAPPISANDPLGAVRRAVAEISERDYRVAEGHALVARVVAASSRDALERLAAAGNARAQGLAGRAYGFGIVGFPLNPTEAIRLYRLAVAQGDPRGQSLLADCYMIGRNIERNEAEAVRLYRLAAAQGSAEGQSGLGVAYSFGQGGVVRDEVEAVRWYRLSANQGAAIGQANLGNMYLLGKGGLAQDDAEAVRWFELSAAQGSYIGQGNLAYMYEVGRGGLAVNRDEAIRLYRLAAIGDDYARDQLRRLGVSR